MLRYTPLVALAGGMVAGISTVKEHLMPFFFTYKYKLYKEDHPEVPFDESTQRAIDEVTTHFLKTSSSNWAHTIMGKLSPATLALIDYYWSNQSEIIHHGSTSTHFGTFIGIPQYFRNNTLSEVDIKMALGHLNTANDVDPKLIQMLRESLVLSDRAKTFAIFTEVNAANTLHVFQRFHFAVPIVGCGLMWNFVYGAVAHRPRIVQHMSLYWLLLMGTLWYYVLEKNLRLSRARIADKRSAEVSGDILDGGIEYVSKHLQRNQALRQLDPKMSQLYSENGDELRSGLFSFPKNSLVSRLKYLNKLKVDLYSAEAIKERKELNKLKYGKEEINK